jgi:hypothetical protein
MPVIEKIKAMNKNPIQAGYSFVSSISIISGLLYI